MRRMEDVPADANAADHAKISAQQPHFHSRGNATTPSGARAFRAKWGRLHRRYRFNVDPATVSRVELVVHFG